MGVNVSRYVRAVVLHRAEGLCENCLRPLSAEYSLHHRRPRGMGGSRRDDTGSPVNLLAVCGTGTTGCHGFFESNRLLAFSRGWLVRQGSSPERVAVLRHGREWVKLKPDGGVRRARTEEIPTVDGALS